jgi:hypothetical protein
VIRLDAGSVPAYSLNIERESPMPAKTKKDHALYLAKHQDTFDAARAAYNPRALSASNACPAPIYLDDEKHQAWLAGWAVAEGRCLPLPCESIGVRSFVPAAV